MSERVPFSILTGFLGAGKTTTLNRLLSAPQGRRIAVLVNELGRIAIDSKLILSRGGDVLELAGGCVCCKVDLKNDLWDGIVDIVRRAQPDNVVLETTGIAEPAAILAGLDRLPAEYRQRIREAGVICVVDADAGSEQLDRREEARAQIEHADRLLLTKLDIAGPQTVERLHQRLDALNAHAERASFPAGDDGTAALTPWLLEVRSRGRAHHREHVHRDGQLVAVSLIADEPLVAERLLALVERHRGQLLRVKGFVEVAGERRRGFLELAGARVELRFGHPWGRDERRTELVMIGEALDEPALRRQLWACRAGGEEGVPF